MRLPLRRPAGLAAALLLGAALAACDAYAPAAPYIAGQVVATVQGVDEGAVRQFAQARRIAVLETYFPETYLQFVIADDGRAADYAPALAALTGVREAQMRGPRELALRVERGADAAALRAAVAAAGPLRATGTYRGQDLVLFGVPAGQETRWARRLAREPFVVSAERNGIVSPRAGG